MYRPTARSRSTGYKRTIHRTIRRTIVAGAAECMCSHHQQVHACSMAEDTALQRVLAACQQHLSQPRERCNLMGQGRVLVQFLKRLGGILKVIKSLGNIRTILEKTWQNPQSLYKSWQLIKSHGYSRDPGRGHTGEDSNHTLGRARGRTHRQWHVWPQQDRQRHAPAGHRMMGEKKTSARAPPALPPLAKA